jgi:Protein of unknown function (DUF3768)
VELFNTFTPDNNPSGKRDFEAFEHQGHTIFWKIDYNAGFLIYATVASGRCSFGGTVPNGPVSQHKFPSPQAPLFVSVAANSITFPSIYVRGGVPLDPCSSQSVASFRSTMTSLRSTG